MRTHTLPAAVSCILVLLPASACLAWGPDTLWTRTYGGPYWEAGHSVQRTFDGGYAIVGLCPGGMGDDDMYLLRVDAMGDTLWTRRFGADAGHDDEAWSVQQTTDGGYVLAGVTGWFTPSNGDVYIVRTDASGDAVWTKTYGGNQTDLARQIRQTQDGGFIIAGYTLSFGVGYSDVWLLKTAANGDTVWSRTYGGPLYDYGFSVQQTADGGYIVAGCFNNDTMIGRGTQAFAPDIGGDVYLVKTDSLGVVDWARAYDAGAWEKGYSVQQTTDGGYIVTGSSYLAATGGCVYTVKTDSDGDTLWTRRYGGGYYDKGCSILQTADNGYIICGRHVSDVLVIRTDSAGDTLWTRIYGGQALDVGYSVAATGDGGYVVAGETFSFGSGYSDVYVVRLGPEITLSCSIEMGEFVLIWNGFPGASAYWVYGAGNDAHFEPGPAPGYQHRLAVLPPLSISWSTTNGVGDENSNWSYLVMAVDSSERESARSNRVGEHDFVSAADP